MYYYSDRAEQFFLLHVFTGAICLISSFIELEMAAPSVDAPTMDAPAVETVADDVAAPKTKRMNYQAW